MEEINLGIIEDPRTDAQRILDFRQEDLVTAAKVKWVEKPQAEWKSYTLRDQDGSYSCCAQSSAKAGEVILKKVLSAQPIYRARGNFPGEGMWLQNVGDIWKNRGTTLEEVIPSQLQNETTIDRITPLPLAPLFKSGGYSFPRYYDIDAIALAIENFGNCLMVVHGAFSEWTDIPVYNPKAEANLGHCVCGVDYFLYNGKKVILIEDSWGKATSMGNGGQRLVTEDYLQARFFGAMSLLDVHPITLYIHKFSHPITHGQSGEEVVALQRVLVKLGHLTMPVGVNYGYYGDLTANGVLQFQLANNVDTASNLVALKGYSVGPLTRASLNKVQNITS